MQLSKLGLKIIEEANNLKRTKNALAKELNISKSTLEKVIMGKCKPAEARDLVTKMLKTYPIDASKLQIVDEEKTFSFTLLNSKKSKKSSRVFKRKNSLGEFVNYYEYRDTAMQKNVPIYPEWIKPLVVVNNNKAQNNLICYNKGHILHQFTFFIGEVNFYWKDNSGYHCKEMNTGDSNYIPPFIPHSFTSRNKKELGLIIAVTFADILSFSRIKFSLYNQKIIESFSGKNDIKNSYLKFFIKNHLNINFIDNKELIKNMDNQGIKMKRACSIINGEKKPNNKELVILSKFLNISFNELRTIAQNKPLEVVNKKLNKNAFRNIESNLGTFKIWDLVKSKYANLIRTFIMDVSYETQNYSINHRLHEYVYNFDNSEIIVKVSNKKFILGPEESIVFPPMIKHYYYKKLKAQNSKILIVRISEEFSEEFIDMFAKLGKSSRKRIFSEASQWF